MTHIIHFKTHHQNLGDFYKCQMTLMTPLNVFLRCRTLLIYPDNSPGRFFLLCCISHQLICHITDSDDCFPSYLLCERNLSCQQESSHDIKSSFSGWTSYGRFPFSPHLVIGRTCKALQVLIEMFANKCSEIIHHFLHQCVWEIFI